MWICTVPRHDHTSKALRYGMSSQKTSQFYLHTPHTSANEINHTCLCLRSLHDRCGWGEHGQLILTKIFKIVATRCQILRLKCTKSFVGWGTTSWWSLHSSQTLSEFRGPTSKGRKRKEGEGKGKENGKGKEGKEKEGKDGKEKEGRAFRLLWFYNLITVHRYGKILQATISTAPIHTDHHSLTAEDILV